MSVFVSIPPQAYFVERVGGEHVRVQVLVQSSQDPHTFEPTPKQIAELGKARLYFKADMPFENRLAEKIRDGDLRLKVVDTAKGIALAQSSESEKDQGHDNSAGSDPHIWLSPPLIATQARNIVAALVDADPSHADAYRRNLESFLQDLDATHKRIQGVLAPYKGASFYVFHPAFGYFADAYGLKQVAVEIEGKSPTPRQLQALIRKARADNVKIIFAQPQFDPRSAEVVADSIGGYVAPMDSLAKDVLRNLEDVAQHIAEAMAK